MQGGMRQRPTGITILAVLAAIGGIFGLLGGLALLGLGGLAASLGGAAVGGLAFVFGLLLLVVGVAELAFAYGAWTLKPWGWQLGVYIQVASIVIAVVEVVLGYANLTGVLLGVVINGIILYYLYQPSVKAAFGKT